MATKNARAHEINEMIDNNPLMEEITKCQLLAEYIELEQYVTTNGSYSEIEKFYLG